MWKLSMIKYIYRCIDVTYDKNLTNKTDLKSFFIFHNQVSGLLTISSIFSYTKLYLGTFLLFGAYYYYNKL